MTVTLLPEGWWELAADDAAAIAEGFCPTCKCRLTPNDPEALAEPMRPQAAVWARCACDATNFLLVPAGFWGGVTAVEVTDEALRDAREAIAEELDRG